MTARRSRGLAGLARLGFARLGLAAVAVAGLGGLGALATLGGCSDEPSNVNPTTLWLANDMVEIRVKLIESEPRPF
jgi:hypothetical protein